MISNISVKASSKSHKVALLPCVQAKQEAAAFASLRHATPQNVGKRYCVQACGFFNVAGSFSLKSVGVGSLSWWLSCLKPERWDVAAHDIRARHSPPSATIGQQQHQLKHSFFATLCYLWDILLKSTVQSSLILQELCMFVCYNTENIL